MFSMDKCKCGVILTDENWNIARKSRNRKICKACVKTQNDERYQRHKATYLKSQGEVRQKIKLEVFNYYGNKCDICHDVDLSNLSLDHVDGGGRRHRKEVCGTDSGTTFYKWVNKNKPNNIRLLCYNCNCKGGSKDVKNKRQTQRQKSRIELKKLVFDNYGGRCINCNHDDLFSLTIDHISGNGAEHRKEIGPDICQWLKNNGFPKDNYQILCYNCNYKKHHRSLKIK